MKIMEWLKGKRTYLCAMGGGVVFVLMQLGYIDKELADWLFGFLGVGAVFSLRAAIGPAGGIDKKG